MISPLLTVISFIMSVLLCAVGVWSLIQQDYLFGLMMIAAAILLMFLVVTGLEFNH